MAYDQNRNRRKHFKPNIVFFDLETTGFDRPIRPVQIGAVDSWGQECFNEFLWPRRHVHPKATLTNNFYACTKTEKLYRHDEELDTIDQEEGLVAFLEWLQSLGGNVILVSARHFGAHGLGAQHADLDPLIAIGHRHPFRQTNGGVFGHTVRRAAHLVQQASSR